MMEHIELNTLDNRSFLSRGVSGKDFINEYNVQESSLSYHDEHERGVHEEARLSMPVKDIASIVYEGHSERTSYDPDGLEEGEIREEEEFMPEKDVARIISDNSILGIISSDDKVRQNRDTTVGQPSVIEETGPINLIDQLNQNISLVTTEELEEGEIRENFNGTECFEQLNMVDLEKGGHLKNQIDEICSRRLQELISKQKAELKVFKIQKRKEEAELVGKHYWDLDRTQRTHISKIRYVKTEQLKQEFKDLMSRFDMHMQLQFRRFIVMQIQARNREKNIKERWTEEAKVGTLEKSFYDIPLSDTGFLLEKFKSSEQGKTHGSPWRIRRLSESSSDLREPVESIEMRGLDTEVVAVGSVRDSKDMPTESEIPASQIICTNLVEFNEIVRPSSHNSVITERVREENFGSSVGRTGDMLIEMVTLASPPNKIKKIEFCKTTGPNSKFSEVNQHGGEEIIYQGIGNTISRPDKTNAALNNFKEINANSRATVIIGKKHGGTGSNGAFSRGPGFQCRKELPFSAYLSTKSRCVESATYDESPPSNGISPDIPKLNQLGCSSQHNLSASQPFMNSVTPTNNVPPVRAQLQYLSPSNVRQERARQFQANYVMPQSRPQEELYSDPLHSELMRLQKINEIITQRHEQKWKQLKSNYDMEIDRVRRKYDELIRDAEIKHLQNEKMLEAICDRIHKHQILAEGFKQMFANHSGLGSTDQFILASQRQFAPCPASLPTSRPTLVSFPSQSPISSGRPFGSSSNVASSIRPALAGQHGSISSNPYSCHLNPNSMAQNQRFSSFRPTFPARQHQRFIMD